MIWMLVFLLACSGVQYAVALAVCVWTGLVRPGAATIAGLALVSMASAAGTVLVSGVFPRAPAAPGAPEAGLVLISLLLGYEFARRGSGGLLALPFN